MKKDKIILSLGIVFSLFWEKNPPRRGAETIWWKGHTYRIIKGMYKEKKKLAKGDGFFLYSTGDSTEIFIAYRSFLDNSLYVNENFKIPTMGKITKLSWGYEIFTNNELCDIISKILEESKSLKTNEYKSEWPNFSLKSDLVMRDLYVAYEGTYIPTEYKGKIGIINGKWAITTGIEKEISENRTLYKVKYVFIPRKYIRILKENFLLNKGV